MALQQQGNRLLNQAALILSYEKTAMCWLSEIIQAGRQRWHRERITFPFQNTQQSVTISLTHQSLIRYSNIMAVLMKEARHNTCLGPVLGTLELLEQPVTISV